MRNSIGSTRELVKERAKRRPATASFGSIATGLLTLPSIHREVPVLSVHDEENGKWLQTAKLCAELVEDDELVINDKTSARDIIGQSLSVWASKHCKEISWLDKFELIASLDRELFSLDCYEGEPSENLLYIGFQSQQTTPFIDVKAKVERLEAEFSGLGRTAIQYAEQAGYRTFTAFSPQVGFFHSQHLYWLGTDNDEDLKIEWEGYGEEGDPEEFCLLPSQYLASFPDYFFNGDVLARDQIQMIASGTGEAAETAKIILSIMDLIDQDARLPYSNNFYAESAFFSCYMGTEGDMLGRVLDDFYQRTGEGEYTDMYGVSEISLNHLSFLNWKQEVEKGFALYTQLDRLMHCIGDIH